MSKHLKIIIAIIGLAVLWLLTLYFRRNPIEQDLTDKVKTALIRPEFSLVEVLFEGRDGTLSGQVSTHELAKEAESLAQKLWGVRVIDNQLIVAAEKSAASANLQGHFQNGKFVLSGIISEETLRSKLVQLVEKVVGAKNVIDQLVIDSSVELPDFFEKAFTVFLGLKGIDEAGFSIAADKFVLKGKVATDATKAQLGSELTRALTPLLVQNDLQVVTPAGSKPPIAELQTLFSNNSIEFDFRSARLSNHAKELLDSASELIKRVPDAKIEIVGHTDNIGADEYNMRLSESRAISIRLYLIAKGVKSECLSIKYYGETQPKAPNDTEEGRQRNRRAEFKIK